MEYMRGCDAGATETRSEVAGEVDLELVLPALLCTGTYKPLGREDICERERTCVRSWKMLIEIGSRGSEIIYTRNKRFNVSAADGMNENFPERALPGARYGKRGYNVSVFLGMTSANDYYWNNTRSGD